MDKEKTVTEKKCDNKDCPNKTDSQIERCWNCQYAFMSGVKEGLRRAEVSLNKSPKQNEQ